MKLVNPKSTVLLLFCIASSFFSYGYHIRRMQEGEPIPDAEGDMEPIPDAEGDMDSIMDTSLLGDIQTCLEANNGSGFYRLLLPDKDEVANGGDGAATDTDIIVYCEMDIKDGNWMRVAHLAGDQWNGYCESTNTDEGQDSDQVEHDLGLHPEDWRIGKINESILHHFFESSAWKQGFHMDEIPGSNMTPNAHLGYEVLLKLPNEGGKSAWLFGQALESTYSTEDSQIISTFVCADNTSEMMTVDSNSRYFWWWDNGDDYEASEEETETDVKVCGCGPLGLAPSSQKSEDHDHDARLLKSNGLQKGSWKGHKGKQMIVTGEGDEGDPRTMDYKSIQLGCSSSSTTDSKSLLENTEYGLHVTGGVCGLLDSMVYPVEVYIRPLSLKLDEKGEESDEESVDESDEESVDESDGDIAIPLPEPLPEEQP